MPSQLIQEIIDQGVPLWPLVLFAVLWAVSFLLLDHLFKRRLKLYEADIRDQLTKRDQSFQKKQKDRDAQLHKELANLNKTHQEHLMSLKVNHDLLTDFMRARRQHVETISGYLREFDHSVEHIVYRDNDYLKRLQEFYQKTREAVRAGTSYLDQTYANAVMAVTDEGRKAEQATRHFDEESIANLERRDVPENVLSVVRPLVGTKSPVLTFDGQVSDLSEEDLYKYRQMILDQSDTDFDDALYGSLNRNAEQAMQEMIHSVPKVMMDDT
ncbi:hypothetical protein [Primorskyibacter sp. 2E233]|uniref:hypothetical protein n=1 Tax=Primorskyibacter sp. 2E233 TaxID=3413431 RepID=UPI003BF07EAE